MTKFEKFHPLAERDEQTAINLMRDGFTAVHPIQPGPMLADEDVDVTAVLSPSLGPSDGPDDTSDAVEVRPFPLGSIDSSDEINDLVAVQPLPLGPRFQ